MTPQTSKRCTRCGQVQPLSEFATRPDRPSGYTSRCRTCCAELQREYYARNQQAEQQKARLRYADNREQILASSRAQYAANPEKAREAGRQRYARNRPRILEATRRQRAEDPRVIERERRQYAALKGTVLAHYGDVCACCGTTEGLSVDHINGDGKQHRIELFDDIRTGGAQMYRWIIANGFPAYIQILCRPCNSSKSDGEHCRLNHAIGGRG